MIRVFLAEDHAIVRDGLRRLLADTPGMELAGETARGRVVLERVGNGELVITYEDHRPVAVVDTSTGEVES